MNNNSFKQTEIGLIPDDWKLIHLDNEDYFETLNGLWKGKKSPFVKINVLRNTNFTNSGKLDYSDVAELDVEIRQYEKRKLLFGDIIIERSGGGPSQPVGRVVFFDRTTGEFSFSNFTSTLRVKKPEEIHHKFLFYSLLSFYFSGRTYALQGRTTGIRNLDFNKYKTTAGVPKLPFSEQRKIAHILSNIQQAIEKHEQIIKTTQELKKTLMQKLLTEGINNEPQRQTEIGLIPQSWEVVELGDICSQRKETLEPKANGNSIYIGLEHIEPGSFYKSNNGDEKDVVSSKYKFYEDDILYGKLRPYLDKSIIPSTKGICSTDIIVLKTEPNIDNKFVLCLFHTESFIKHAVATTSGVNHPRTNYSSLKKFKFALPNSDEQKRISEITFRIEDKILIAKESKRITTDLFKTMLNQLMSGQLRVKDIDLSAVADLELEKVHFPSV